MLVSQKKIKDVIFEDKVWIFDLDNTLYPKSCDLFTQISERIDCFIATNLAISGVETKTLRKRYCDIYGTTMRGLMSEHSIVAESFLSFVHDIDISALAPNPRLASALASLPGRRLVFTNGSVRHAENVLASLGIDRYFEAIFDIAASNFIPKPDSVAYMALIARHAIRPEKAVMIEDLELNLVPAHALGMTTVLVVEDKNHCTLPHVHYITDDLSGWLAQSSSFKENKS